MTIDTGLLETLKLHFINIATTSKRIHNTYSNKSISIAVVCNDEETLEHYVTELNKCAEEFYYTVNELRKRINDCDKTVTINEQLTAQSEYAFHCHGYGNSVYEQLAIAPGKPRPIFCRDISSQSAKFAVYDWVICLDVFSSVSHGNEYYALANLLNLFHAGLILVWGGESNKITTFLREPEEIIALFRAAKLFYERELTYHMRESCEVENNKDELLVFRRM